LFLAVFGLSVLPYGYMNDYLTPYSHEATHGLFLCLWGFVILERFIKTKLPIYLFIIGVTEACLFLSKPEFFAASLAIPLAVIIGAHKKEKALGWLTLGFLSGMLPFLIYFISKLGLVDGLISVASPWYYILTTSVSQNYYYRLVLGLEGFRYNIETSLAYLLLYLSIFVIVKSAEKLYQYNKKITAYSLLVSLLIFATIFLFNLRVLEDFCAGFSFLITILFIYRTLKKRELFESTFLLFCSLLMLKIFFKVAVYGYGFVLVPPSIFALFLTLKNSSRIAKVSSIYLSLVLIIAYSIKTFTNTSENQFKIGHGTNSFTVAYPFSQYNEVLAMIEQQVPTNKSLVAFPEGLFLNFLTERVHPVRSTNFMPPEFDIFGEETILTDLIAGHPDYILLINNLTRPEFIYNSNFFNRDYAQTVHDWIYNHYHQTSEYKDIGGQYILMKRNGND